MKYVLDASVAVKWTLPEADSAKANQLRNDFRNSIHEFLAPDIFTAEVGHALARAERRKIIPIPQGTIFLADILSTIPQLVFSFPNLITRAFEIASQMRSGVYDCLYVALSEEEKCQMVTADDRLIKNLQPFFPQIISLASFP